MQLHQIPYQVGIWEAATGKVTLMFGSVLMFSHYHLPICHCMIMFVSAGTLTEFSKSDLMKYTNLFYGVLHNFHLNIRWHYVYLCHHIHVFFLFFSLSSSVYFMKVFCKREAEMLYRLFLFFVVLIGWAVWCTCMLWESSVLHAQGWYCKIIARRYHCTVFEKYLKLQYWWIMWYSSRGQVC